MKPEKVEISKMIELLAIISKEQNKEEKVRDGLNCIMEGNGFVDITAGLFEAIKLLISVELYDWLSYYLWECNRKGNVTVASGTTYIFETDEEFVNFLVAEGYIS